MSSLDPSHLWQPFQRTTAWRVSLAGALCLTILGIAPTVALAGTNGQQVELYAPAEQSAQICGTNQYNQQVCHRGNITYPWSLIKSWWWKGQVTISSYSSTSERGYLGTTTCQVPTSQTGSDKTVCIAVRPAGYPYKRTFGNLGGKLYNLVSATWAYDYLFQRYIPRSIQLGYWEGHYVYKTNNQVGVDINTGQVVIAQTTNHWIVLGGAVSGAKACNPSGVSWAGVATSARAAVTAWCAAGGAAIAFFS
jgi:hypothetical protein